MTKMQESIRPRPFNEPHTFGLIKIQIKHESSHEIVTIIISLLSCDCCENMVFEVCDNKHVWVAHCLDAFAFLVEHEMFLTKFIRVFQAEPGPSRPCNCRRGRCRPRRG